MTQGFDSEALARLAWRQGSILGPKLAQHALTYAPKRVAMDDEDRLIVTSHDCDVVSPSLDKEPVVEILRGRITTASKMDKQLSGGRNPRILHLAFEAGATGTVLVCSVHDRWPIPRELLQREVPQGQLADKERRLVAEWLAKRYIRAAFPTAFESSLARENENMAAVIATVQRVAPRGVPSSQHPLRTPRGRPLSVPSHSRRAA